MTTEKMTIHEALCKLKTADKRLYDLEQNSIFIDAKKAVLDKIKGVSVKEYNQSIQSNYDKINDVLKETQALKAAISKSNAETMITVAGKEMSVAEAIYFFKYGVAQWEELLDKMTTEYKNVTNTVEKKNGADLDSRAEAYITSLYGSKDKVNADEVAKATEDYKEKQKYELVDPLNLNTRIAELREWIDSFKTSVDSAIQVSNATTIIEVTF